ncbi:MAG: GntR family transcriptional regulator [Rhizobiaceae bacterium MnEN-MB40S]|nr:MAG: GntR family transcriptional regulator [Rhizobiaceae bacterium MnEN-MB40S]
MSIQVPLEKDHRPIYIQIAETLRARIVSGYYEDKIDGELPLAREWNVSRRTIQQALDILIQEGLVRRQHGLGTFVNHTGVDNRYKAITSITEGIAGQGLTPQFRVLSSGPVEADEEAREFFGLPAGEPVYLHERLVSGGGRSLALVATTLNLKLLEGLELSHLDGSLYATLRKRFGRTIVQAEDKYIPAVADATTANMLGIAENSPIFIAIRRATDQTGTPIELSRISMLPVALDISIQRVGFAPKGDIAPADKPEWHYSVGFGDFRS